METQPIEAEPLPAPILGEWPEGGLEAVSACPVCRESRRSRVHDDLQDRIFGCAPGRFTLYRCEICGSGYLDPRPTAATIGLAYTQYYTHTPVITEIGGERRPSWKQRLKGLLSDGYLNARYGYRVKPAWPLGALLLPLLPELQTKQDHGIRHLRCPMGEGRLLDVGCGNGAFLQHVRRYGWQAEGLDFDASAVAAAKAIGVPVREGALEEGLFPADAFDAVTLSHIIEHVYDPIKTLRICYQILKPGGMLWMVTPNMAAAGHTLFGKFWRGLEPPRHLVLFTAASLRQAMEQTGFVRCYSPPAKPVTHWFFSVSAAIEQGVVPGSSASLSVELKQRADEIDRQAWDHPELAEEITLIGYKPEQ
ncbi:MAG TPA: class I SAM-dependent methyltransferase [Chthonomonadaceae bacterium]|nr:class I SAM-dependent methyltransferase [Chthonomonadaceae bacterium]